MLLHSQDVALEWQDNKGNNHLHATVVSEKVYCMLRACSSSPVSVPAELVLTSSCDGRVDSESIEAKLGLCVTLFEHCFILNEKNMDGKTVL